ncbi:ribonuclease E inhibitor RraB [Neptunicella sp. SCSIO 80796]|uniref:ribonuclease E inhibitor RraB n=1 Tax=Neptunicella plasticusilytica TaxID=3117012 RepID=UPI003A4DC5FF
MSTEQQEWYAFNLETVEALLEDGSNPDATYNIEYHFACDNFDRLEKAAVDAFKAGFEVGDAEELTLDDGGTILCFDATVERKLDVEQINKDTDILLAIAAKHKVHYDGWGTHFIE